jgi:hypothetical protein
MGKQLPLLAATLDLSQDFIEALLGKERLALLHIVAKTTRTPNTASASRTIRV